MRPVTRPAPQPGSGDLPDLHLSQARGLRQRPLAYASDRTGTDEIYVASWPDGEDLGRISLLGGREALWSRVPPDGKFVFVRGPPGSMREFKSVSNRVSQLRDGGEGGEGR